jgi:hypothetical protein
MRLVLVGFVAATVIGGGTTEADFTFGEPSNLGPSINTQVEDGGPCISADGLSLYFYSFLEGWAIGTLRMATQETTNDPWGETTSLEPQLSKGGAAPCISADGLSLYYDFAGGDIYVSKRPAVSDPWGEPTNLGPSVNSLSLDMGASISTDGLELFFGSDRVGGSGDWDVYVTKRSSASAPWDTAVNLGPTVNSSAFDGHPCISPDGLMLLLTSNRSGGYGDWDIWMSRRPTRDDDWSAPANLGPAINTWAGESEPSISANGQTLYFSDWMTPRSGGVGKIDLWQAPILPIVDFNGDSIVDVKDVLILTEHWGQDYSLCDIGPTPLGDGIVDVQDLAVLTEYIKPIDRTLIAHWALDEMEGDIAKDSAGSDDDAFVIGSRRWEPDSGKIGGALRFDGVDDYVSTPFILNPREASFSVTAWILGGAPGQVIISQADADEQGPVESGSTWLGLSPLDGGLMSGLMDIFFGPLESELVVTDGQWHHVGLVYDRTTMKRHLYVDGAEVAVDTYAVGGVESTAGLYIGAGQTLDSGTFFSGLIDDVRIYSVALNPEKIEALAQ